MIEQTFAMIKPNAVRKNIAGKILSMWEEAGFEIVQIKKVHMTKAQAEGFYAEHTGKGFFEELTSFMSSGPTYLLVLAKEDAVLANRELMGATNPEKAAEGTIRKLYGDSLGENSVHGSDSIESARREIRYFFNVFEAA